MNYRRLLLLAMLAFSAPSLHAAEKSVEGMIERQSPYSTQATIERAEQLILQKGLKIFARIDHSAAAASVGQTLPPTQLLIFGNAQGGTPLMQCAQSMGIDLPLKLLVWEDKQNRVWLAYNDPAWIASRHHVNDCPAVAGMSTMLNALTESITQP